MFDVTRFNRYLKAVGSDREVGSFGAELADGVAWCSLLNAIDPAACPPPDEFDPEGNASNAINAAKKMGVKVRWQRSQSVHSFVLECRGCCLGKPRFC